MEAFSGKWLYYILIILIQLFIVIDYIVNKFHSE